jgi:hypothetical protein
MASGDCEKGNQVALNMWLVARLESSFVHDHIDINICMPLRALYTKCSFAWALYTTCAATVPTGRSK